MSTVAQKLGIKPGMTIASAGLPQAETAALLGPVPNGVRLLSRGVELADQLILAASSLDELDGMLVGSWDEIASGGRLWVWYRKGAKAAGDATPLHRDTLQSLLAEHGMDGVTLVSIDDRWSAMRVKQL
jgi:hypothetical protein